jgi:hypothetical protein
MKSKPLTFVGHTLRLCRVGLPLLCGAGLLSGCTSLYNVTFTHGSVLTVKGRPKLDPATDTYSFSDVAGRRYKVPALTVRQIEPASESRDLAKDPLKGYPGR